MDLKTASDQELIVRILEGDSTCYDLLFDRYRQSLYGATLQRCGNPQQAREVLEEAFVRIYFNLHRYDPAYPFGPWAHKIAQNLFIDQARRKRTSPWVEMDERSEQNTPSEALNPEERIISVQSSTQLNALLKEMPPHYRTMIELRFWHEYSYEEIAEKLGVPLGTVKTRIHRAREKFCELITDKKLW